jgi:hypothetical protein
MELGSKEETGLKKTGKEVAGLEEQVSGLLSSITDSD